MIFPKRDGRGFIHPTYCTPSRTFRTMKTERLRTGSEIRAEGRKLSGTVMRFGDISPSHKERFEPGSIRMAEAVHLDLFHDVERAVAWMPGGGLELRQDNKALTLTAKLPPIPAADRAISEIKSGNVTGLSVEFQAIKESRDAAGIRVIEDAVLSGIGIVKHPSYTQSSVEARRRSGRTMTARIPAGKKVACRCSGASCRFAKLVQEGLQEAMDDAFDEFQRTTIADFNSYNAPLASTQAGTLRGRTLKNGDGEVEIDLPDDPTGAAVIAANESAGVVVRPYIDADAAESIVEGSTRVYTKMPIRAFLVSATDERDGWPASIIKPTPDELAHSHAPRKNRRRKFFI